MIRFSLKKKNYSDIGRKNKLERGRNSGRETSRALMEEMMRTWTKLVVLSKTPLTYIFEYAADFKILRNRQ